MTASLLCIEVLSPEDMMMRMFRKIDDYLAIGLREVWLVDPVRRVISVRAGEGMKEYRSGALGVPEVPVSVSVEKLFGAFG